jgi:TM2 domain-containing membrane protein YozV
VTSPGWYSDPGSGAQQRFWDGVTWTAQVRPAQAWPPPPPGSPFPAVPPAGVGMVAPKNPAVSLIVSFFIPGVGSMINGDVGTGVAILLLWIAGAILTLFIFGIVIAVGAWIWGMVDAYKGAQRWNARHGIIS